ncbi:MAG: methyltransferase domain-containing protein [Micromonosporaceae bacterium]|nr:methyltransferase domain-containing protein [Micromonosporaceae bacterium]
MCVDMARIQGDPYRMIEATVEHSNVVSNQVAACAAHGRFFDAVEHFSTVGEIGGRLGVHPTKTKALVAMLKCLADRGDLEEREVAGKKVYRRKTAAPQVREGTGDLGRAKLDRVMDGWGGNAADFNWIARAGNLLGHDLSFLKTDAADKVPFGRRLLSTSGMDWKYLLTEPVYDLGRLKAVRDLANYGSRFLDLACGPGFGTQRLAEVVVGGCEVVGVDMSNEMLEEARRVIYSGAKATFILRDLNTGLPPLQENSFDGILFNGAFHFIQDKRARLLEMYRVLRPGGGLVLAHNFGRSGLNDESTWEFYFALLKAEIYPIEFEDLRIMLSDTGFVEYDQYHRGSFSYIHVRKPVGEFQPARQPLPMTKANERPE